VFAANWAPGGQSDSLPPGLLHRKWAAFDGIHRPKMETKFPLIFIAIVAPLDILESLSGE
jgi:hypothetical protein